MFYGTLSFPTKLHSHILKIIHSVLGWHRGLGWYQGETLPQIALVFPLDPLTAAALIEKALAETPEPQHLLSLAVNIIEDISEEWV